MDKMFFDLVIVVVGIEDGMMVMIGGFGGLGGLMELIYVLIDCYLVMGYFKNLMVVNNNVGNGYVGFVVLIEQGMVVKLICFFLCFVDLCVFIEVYQVGKIEFELVLQGMLVECICVGGVGILVFYIFISYGIDLVNGKKVEEFDGCFYVQECWLKVDYVLVKVDCGDWLGNLIYCMVVCNFGFVMCMVVVMIIVQVLVVVEFGSIDLEVVVMFGIFVQGIVEVVNFVQEEQLNCVNVCYLEVVE